MAITREDFIPVRSLTREKLATIGSVQRAFELTAETVLELVPASEHQQAALRLLLEAKFTAVQGITHR